jgi:hypothetical protein
MELMTSIREYFHRRLTVWETAGVVIALTALAGLGYLIYSFITAKILQAQVKAAIPQVCAEIRDQRRVLLGAIEAYKAHFGVYPPDHVISRQPLLVDAVKNPLFYELAGVVYNPNNKMFEVQGQESADAKFVREFFHGEGFKNCVEKPGEAKRFLAPDLLPARQLHDDPDVFAVGFTESYEKGLTPEVVGEFEISPWRYVSSAPTNNPGKFDLWIEIEAAHRRITIGNWAAIE